MKSVNPQCRETGLGEKVKTMSTIIAVEFKGNESTLTEVDFLALVVSVLSFGGCCYFSCGSALVLFFFLFLFLFLFGLHLFERH